MLSGMEMRWGSWRGGLAAAPRDREARNDRRRRGGQAGRAAPRPQHAQVQGAKHSTAQHSLPLPVVMQFA